MFVTAGGETMKYGTNSREYAYTHTQNDSELSMISGYQQQNSSSMTGNSGFLSDAVEVDAYGVSDCGFSDHVNTDNIYLNGIYMKSFIYSHFSKGIRCMGNNMMFAVCHNCDDEGGKQLLYDLDKEKEILFSRGIKSTNDFFDYMTNKNNLTKSSNMELGALYISEYGVSAYALGGSRVYFLSNGKLTDISCSEAMRNIYIGQYHCNMSKAKPITSIAADGVYVICTSVIANTLSSDTISGIVSGLPPREAAKAITEKTVSMNSNSDGSVSCIVIKPSFRRKYGLSKKIRQVLFAVTGLLLALCLILGVVFSIQVFAHESAAISPAKTQGGLYTAVADNYCFERT